MYPKLLLSVLSLMLLAASSDPQQPAATDVGSQADSAPAQAEPAKSAEAEIGRAHV